MLNAPAFFLFAGGREGAKNSPARHGQRWPTAPLDESSPESYTNGHHDREMPPPPNQKNTTRKHSHRLAPTWCGAGGMYNIW